MVRRGSLSAAVRVRDGSQSTGCGLSRQVSRTARPRTL